MCLQRVPALRILVYYMYYLRTTGLFHRSSDLSQFQWQMLATSENIGKCSKLFISTCNTINAFTENKSERWFYTLSKNHKIYSQQPVMWDHTSLGMNSCIVYTICRLLSEWGLCRHVLHCLIYYSDLMLCFVKGSEISWLLFVDFCCSLLKTRLKQCL